MGQAHPMGALEARSNGGQSLATGQNNVNYTYKTPNGLLPCHHAHLASHLQGWASLGGLRQISTRWGLAPAVKGRPQLATGQPTTSHTPCTSMERPHVSQSHSDMHLQGWHPLEHLVECHQGGGQVGQPRYSAQWPALGCSTPRVPPTRMHHAMPLPCSWHSVGGPCLHGAPSPPPHRATPSELWP